VGFFCLSPSLSLSRGILASSRFSSSSSSSFHPFSAVAPKQQRHPSPFRYNILHYFFTDKKIEKRGGRNTRDSVAADAKFYLNQRLGDKHFTLNYKTDSA
jgi:hypothetical protein